MGSFIRCISIAAVIAAVIFAAYGARAQSGAKSDLPASWGEPSEPLPPGSVTLEELDRRRTGGPAPAGQPASAPATPPPAPVETAGPPPSLPSESPAAPPPSRTDPFHTGSSTPAAAPRPSELDPYPGQPGTAMGAPAPAPAPAMGAPAPAPAPAPRISTLQRPEGPPPPASHGSPAPAAQPAAAASSGYGGPASDLPGQAAEPLPPGSITLEDYDARMRTGGAPASSGAPAAAPAAPAPGVETTEEVTGDVYGKDEIEDSSEAPSRWGGF